MLIQSRKPIAKQFKKEVNYICIHFYIMYYIQQSTSYFFRNL
ncbi:hypothetical protein [Romboutsia faecis]